LSDTLIDHTDHLPRRLGDVRNFGWVKSPWLARGEQPPHRESSYRALSREGIGAVFSLREDGEKALEVTGRLFPEYRAAEERDICEAVGLHFRHLECRDLTAPTPAQVEASLRMIDEETSEGRAVFVHCLGGVGRTGTITGAWLIANGGSANEAAARYVLFFAELGRELGLISEAQQANLFKNAGIPQQMWTLHLIARTLGRPLTEVPRQVKPLRPAGSEGWEGEFERLLEPWKLRAE
jgi:hypothetical protein